MRRIVLVLVVISFAFAANAQVQVKIGQGYVQCKVNGLDFKCLVGTGVTAIAATDVSFMIKNGFIIENDITGATSAQIAKGEIPKEAKILIRKIEIAGSKLENVYASIVGEQQSSLYLGISSLQRLGKVEISGNELLIYAQRATTTQGMPLKHANEEVWNPDGIELIFVEGSGDGIYKQEGFYIGKYEVTQAQWKAIMGDNNNPFYFKGDDLPVERVSWDDAQEFITKLNVKTGGNYRLPTEKEWEYAAREGKAKSSNEYSGSNDVAEVAWYDGNSDNATHKVGTKKSNALGIYDMSGNVGEWCEDCYSSSCSYRVVRGSSWYDYASDCRVSFRAAFSPGDHYYFLGFRLVCSSK
jgi:hypothetical protein